MYGTASDEHSVKDKKGKNTRFASMKFLTFFIQDSIKLSENWCARNSGTLWLTKFYSLFADQHAKAFFSQSWHLPDCQIPKPFRWYPRFHFTGIHSGRSRLHIFKPPTQAPLPDPSLMVAGGYSSWLVLSTLSVCSFENTSSLVGFCYKKITERLRYNIIFIMLVRVQSGRVKYRLLKTAEMLLMLTRGLFL